MPAACLKSYFGKFKKTPAQNMNCLLVCNYYSLTLQLPAPTSRSRARLARRSKQTRSARRSSRSTCDAWPKCWTAPPRRSPTLQYSHTC